MPRHRLGPRGIAVWLVSIGLIGAASAFRLLWDGLMCGDDGTADYGGRDAAEYCDVLDDRLNAFDVVSPTFGFGPPSLYFFFALFAITLVGSAIALHFGALRARTAALTTIAALILLIAVPSVSASTGFAGLYFLPVAIAVAGTFVAFPLDVRLWVPIAAATALTGLLFIPSLYVSF